MAKLYKIKLVKQQSFNFSHNLLKRCLVLRQDYLVCNHMTRRSCIKLYKIRLVKQQSFNFSHNLLKRCLVLRQDYLVCNHMTRRSCIKLYKIKLVKQQTFNFFHNLLKRCFVLRQDYVQKWQGQISSFSCQAHAHSKPERSVLALKMGPIRRVKLNTVLFLSLIWLP